ncbi:1305_t:CDS:2 [Paraglomus occultum]|uniref:1305_t:CDS:1 n=1 Tax=Paraglomus occultum TaxID=144539 RepID=A0A9N8Z480_9GLOM|nr:1305_t:CDS:2 [Paraglomus occultum]
MNSLSQRRKASIPQIFRFAKHAQVPEYSPSPSELTSGFELKAIGNVFRTKDKYLCGDILDNRFFLIGTSSGLDFIDLSLPTEKQTAKRIIEGPRFKQIKIVKTRKNAISGRNSHLRSYTLYSLKILIFAQLAKASATPPPTPTPKHSKRFSNPFFNSRPSHSKRASLQQTPRRNLPHNDVNTYDLHHSEFHDRHFFREQQIIGSSEEMSIAYEEDSQDEEYMDALMGEEDCEGIRVRKGVEIVEEIINVGNAGKMSVSVGVKTSMMATVTSSYQPSMPSNSHSRNRVSMSAFPFAPRPSPSFSSSQHSKKSTGDFVKLPHTKLTISFVVSVGVARSYVAALAKQNIYLFEMTHDENNTNKQQWVHTRTYWLPSTPDYLELAVHGEQLVDIIAAFGNEIILIGVEDSRIREVSIADELRPNYDDEYDELDDADESTTIWRTFTQLPFLPSVNPENVSDPFTIPPSYALASTSPPSSFLHPTTVFDATEAIDLFCSGPLLFFATFGSRSMVVDAKGRPFSTIIFEWSFSPQSVCFFRGGIGTNDAYVVGFGRDVIEIRSFRTGLVVENVVKGVEVTFLGTGRSEENEVILACRFEKGIKGVDLYSLKAPTNGW